ncbi:hypothetical protein B9Z65_7276 [Elsinoe australis]|uniref:SWIM-type domain-containing protein n=1 Tax=Elsinoe australis TaxID=40998 RepID=A0A2P7Z6A1_9PEZI|nr:hypothetical protein B9Z65_7276 [Elsinoe australis]
MSNPGSRRSAPARARSGQGREAPRQSESGVSQPLRRSNRKRTRVQTSARAEDTAGDSEASDDHASSSEGDEGGSRDRIEISPVNADDVNPPGELIYDLSAFTSAEQRRIKKARTSTHAPTFHMPRFIEITSPGGQIDFCIDLNSQERVVLQSRRRGPSDRLLSCTCTKNIKGPKTPLCEHIWHFQEKVIRSLYSEVPQDPITFDTTDATVHLPGADEPVSLYSLFSREKDGLLAHWDLTPYQAARETEYQKSSQHVLCVAYGSDLLPSEMFSDAGPGSPTEFAGRRISDLLLRRATLDSTIHEQLKKLLAPQVIQRALLQRLETRVRAIFADLSRLNSGDTSGLISINGRLRQLARSIADYDEMYTGDNALLEDTRKDLANFLLSIIAATLDRPELFAQTIAPSFPQGGLFVVTDLGRFADVIDENMMMETSELARSLHQNGAPEVYIRALRAAITGRQA